MLLNKICVYTLCSSNKLLNLKLYIKQKFTLLVPKVVLRRFQGERRVKKKKIISVYIFKNFSSLTGSVSVLTWLVYKETEFFIKNSLCWGFSLMLKRSFSMFTCGNIHSNPLCIPLSYWEICFLNFEFPLILST